MSADTVLWVDGHQTPFLEPTRLLFLSPEVWSHKGGKKLSKDYRDPPLRQLT